MSGSRDDGCTTHSVSRLSSRPRLDRRRRDYSLRLFVAQFLGLVGIVLYNWWVWVVLASTLLTSTDEFFSDLEAVGRPDASVFQHFDLAAGVVMFVAFLLRGPWGPKGKRAEWHLRLPLHHYLHVISGIIEFATMTTAVYFARRRTKECPGWVSRSLKGVWVALLTGYPLLAVAYLTDEFGAFVEPIFFV